MKNRENNNKILTRYRQVHIGLFDSIATIKTKLDSTQDRHDISSYVYKRVQKSSAIKVFNDKARCFIIRDRELTKIIFLELLIRLPAVFLCRPIFLTPLPPYMRRNSILVYFSPRLLFAIACWEKAFCQIESDKAAPTNERHF